MTPSTKPERIAATVATLGSWQDACFNASGKYVSLHLSFSSCYLFGSVLPLSVPRSKKTLICVSLCEKYSRLTENLKLYL